MLMFIVRKSQCTGGNAKEKGGATTAGHKRKLNHQVTTHNIKKLNHLPREQWLL